MPLIVTDDGERKVEEGYSKSVRRWMIATIILVVIALAFIVAGWYAIIVELLES